MPVGEYDLHITARGFASFGSSGIRVDVNRTISLPVSLQIGPSSSRLTVAANAATIDVSSTLGNVVSSREITDLPLNGRNFTQLGLLQPGVAPLTSGLAEAGGILRSGQAYAVNGERPESNNYLLDGATNVDSVNGGFALRTPVDAVSEFRILTSNAPAEYGQTSGATTTVVTKSGGNSFHGDQYQTRELSLHTYPRGEAPNPQGLLGGLSTHGTGRFERAIEASQKEIAADPDFVIGYLSLAWSFFLTDRFPEAESTLQRASERKLKKLEMTAMREDLPFFIFRHRSVFFTRRFDPFNIVKQSHKCKRNAAGDKIEFLNPFRWLLSAGGTA